MRFLVFFMMTCAVFLIPAVGLADNQQVAQYIADRLGEKFPANSIHVKYNSGEVTLSGDMHSPQQINEALQYVSSLSGVTKVMNSMKVSQTLNQPLQFSSSVIAPERAILPSDTMPTAAPLPTGNPLNSIDPMISPVSGTMEANRPSPVTQVAGPMLGRGDVPTPLAYSSSDANVVGPAYQSQPLPPYRQNYDAPYIGNVNQPMPVGVQNATTARYDQPNLPPYAWPSYAPSPNYAEVAYPRNYCPESSPYIGPFYPYPQVPLGWRKVTMEWHDGWWWLDFDDGTAKGPFSPLFRQPNPQRY